MPRFSRSNPSSNESHQGKHRFEHWYRDNSVYFITARCANKKRAFGSEKAKLIFWDRLDYHSAAHGFEPWVRTLLDNHYHILGYLLHGNELGELMRKVHGSVAKLVNDELSERCVPFWCEDYHNNYFDGCIRDVLQLDRAYRYTRDQAVRARIVRDYRDYPHTRINISLEDGIAKATTLEAFLAEVPYQRYDRKGVPKR